MKKRVLIIGICIILVIVSIIVYFIFQQKYEQGKAYTVEKITEYKYFVSKLENEQKFGVIDAQGNILIPEEYDMVKIPNPSKPVFICQTGEKNIVLDASGKQIYTEYETIDLLQLK